MKNNRNRRYHNKIPPFLPAPQHWTRKSRSWKAKVPYNSEDAAWEWLNQNPRIRALGFTVYRCAVCSKWHIGHLQNEK